MPVVGVVFDDPDTRHEWVVRLSEHLDDLDVVDAEAVDPSHVEIAVVGNPPGGTLARFESLRFVQSAWAGVDRLLAAPPPVPVARMVAPELTGLMSEFVLAAVLSLHRRFPSYRRDQARARWRPRPTPRVRETRVGVLGFGELGGPVAQVLSSVGFDVAAWARSPRAGPIPVLTGREGFRDLLECSGIVVNLLPLTSDTRGILDRAAFGAMPRGAAVVNAARGAHLVEADLLEALDGGQLSDALLDVFDEEPLPADHPFWSHDRVTVLPHVAAPSRPEDLAPHLTANIRRFLDGRTPRFLVQPPESVPR